MKRSQVNKQRFTIHEQKTGKARRIYIHDELQKQLLQYGGDIYIFENRLNPKKPRTRQAVYKDLKRAAKLFRVTNVNVCPHSARKIFAVGQFQKTGSLKKVQQLLNHSDEAVTQLYAMADAITEKRKPKKK